MTEAQVLSKVTKKLQFLKITGDIVWYTRLQSGRIGNITLNRAGTPDLMALVNNRDGTISALFIEVKRSGIKRLRYEQKIFFEEMEGKPKTMCAILNDPKQLGGLIKKAREL